MSRKPEGTKKNCLTKYFIPKRIESKTDGPGRPLNGDARALGAEQLGVVVGGGGVGGGRQVVVEPLDGRA